MRELPEEIKSIPKCCCDVAVRGFEDVEHGFSIVYCQCGGLFSAVPVDDEQFDITKHEWSDVIAEIEAESGHTLVLKFKGSWISLDKDDAIAIARDRGLTAEDLK